MVTHCTKLTRCSSPSIDQEGESEISIRSDIVSGDFKGTINLFSLPTVFKQHVNRYFSLQDKTLQRATDPQDFKFDLTYKKYRSPY
jgi:translocation and assembly module TamB